MEHEQLINRPQAYGFVIERAAEMSNMAIEDAMFVVGCGVAIDYFSRESGIAIPNIDYSDKIRRGLSTAYVGSPSYHNGFIRYLPGAWTNMNASIEEAAHLFHFYSNRPLSDEDDRLARASEITGPKGFLTKAFLSNVAEYVGYVANVRLLKSEVAVAWSPTCNPEHALAESIRSITLLGIDYTNDLGFRDYGLASKWFAITDINRIELRDAFQVPPYDFEDYLADALGIPKEDLEDIYFDWEQQASIIQRFRG